MTYKHTCLWLCTISWAALKRPRTAFLSSTLERSTIRVTYVTTNSRYALVNSKFNVCKKKYYLIIHASSLSLKGNMSSANQEIPLILWKAKDHCCIHKCCHMSLIRTRVIQSMPPQPNSWKSIIILSSQQHLDIHYLIIWNLNT